MRLLTTRAVTVAAVLMLPVSSQAYNYVFVDGLKRVNGAVEHHDNDSNNTGEPIHVLLPELTLGSGSSVRSAGTIEPGVFGDLTLGTLSLKSRASLGAIAATTDEISLRGQARLDTSFEITSAGAQSISIAWSGQLHATGDALAQYNLKLGFNPWNGVYNLLNVSDFIDASNPGNVSATDSVIDEEMTFLMDFDLAEVGQIYNLQVFLTTYAAMTVDGGATEGSYADFFNSFAVTSWSDGLDSTEGLTIEPPLVGDFDLDSDVDGADFLMWQRDPSIGSLTDWQTNYGSPPPLADSRAAVPEPATVLLLVAMTSMLCASWQAAA